MAPSAAPPGLSVIVPARDAAATLGACLEALSAQAGADVEVIVVDDASHDATAATAARYPVRLVRLRTHRGVSAARNLGAARARAALLLFLDADCVLAPGAIARGRAALANPDLDGVFGAYDDAPAAPTLVSRWKNLLHHHVHGRAHPEARTFWAGCGFLRRARFLAAGGFDRRRFPLPSIEDVELGYRLTDAGARLRLDPGLQVKHLKRWRLPSLIATDVLRRAIPWTLLACERGRLPGELNTAAGERAAALVALAIVIVTPLAVRSWPAAIALVVLVGVALVLGRRLYGLFARRGGLRLAAAGFVLQQLYYLYSLAGFAAGVAVYYARRLAAYRARLALAVGHA